jgi:hypothetical protein
MLILDGVKDLFIVTAGFDQFHLPQVTQMV